MWEALANLVYDLIVKAAVRRGKGGFGWGMGIKMGYFQSVRSV